jgi:hypothetical protein
MPGLFDEIRDLAKLLEANNQPAWAKRLIDSLEGGSTGGEVLMAVRWNLQELLRTEIKLPEAIKSACQRSIREIDASGV